MSRSLDCSALHFVVCRWCETDEAATNSGLCSGCAKKPRVVRMASPYRGHRGRCGDWEEAHDDVFSALDIFERDGWLCGICGADIDRGLGFPDPFSACVDHVDPLPGGSNVPENVRAAHLRCNARRARGKLQAAHSEVKFLSSRPSCGDAAYDDSELFEAAVSALRQRSIRRALGLLPERERRILELRFGFEGEPWTLEEIARELNITHLRVRQLEIQALKRLGALQDLGLMTA